MSIQLRLEERLQSKFKPIHFLLENESHLHGGAARDPGKIRESHFKVVIVSEQFREKRLLQQHQLVYQAVGDIMKEIHALALHTYTPEEWSLRQGAPDSPQCPKAG